jgi:hypothetical protein
VALWVQDISLADPKLDDHRLLLMAAAASRRSPRL